MTIQSIADFLVPIAFILAILMPLWALWLGARINRHLYHMETALWQIRDTLRTHEPQVSVPEQRHVAHSMFGR